MSDPSDIGMSNLMSDPPVSTRHIWRYRRPGGSDIGMSNLMSDPLPTRVVLHSRSDVGPRSRPTAI